MAEPSILKPALPALAAILLLTSCEGLGSDDRQEDQRLVRAERLSRARAQRARRARLERLRKRVRPGPSNPATNPPPLAAKGPCDPARELKRRVTSSLFNDRFIQAVRLVLTPIRADLVELKGKPFQRFTFTVRMHPDDAPRFGRPRRRADLELDLRFTPLCGLGGPIRKSEVLRVRLVRRVGRKRAPRATTGLWPQRSRAGTFRVPVGTPIQLLLDPSRAALRQDRRPPGSGATLGLWEILAARFAGRPRTQRLSLASSHLPVTLRRLHAVEVVCGRKPDKRCRFLTRHQGRRSVVTSFGALVRLAAPIGSVDQVRQLHAVQLSLRFGACGGDARRETRRGRRNPCFGRSATWPPCQFWRAQMGYGNAAIVRRRGSRFFVSHVIACPGQKQRVLELHATYERKGRQTLTVTDLTPRASHLLERARRLTSRRRKRR